MLLSSGMNNSLGRRKYIHQFKETARQDPYRQKSKPRGTPRCPSCGSFSIQGRWLSSSQIKGFHSSELLTLELKCPACKQLEDRYAMGVVELRGESWKTKKDLIMNTIRNTEGIARYRNDQERVLWINEWENVTKIYVALPELARHIGRELERSFHGSAEYERSTEEPYLRVRWWSDLRHIKHSPGSFLNLKDKSILLDQDERTVHRSKAFRGRSRSK